MNIGMIGCGKLGLPCILAMEHVGGHTVFGYDPSSAVSEYVRTKKVPYQEPGTNEYLQTTNLKMTSLEEVVASSEIIFVAVQTPHLPLYEGTTRVPETRVDFDYSYLKTAMADISRAVEAIGEDRIVVIISTVMPGTIDREIRPLLSPRVKLCFNPYFIAMSTTIQDFLNPEFVLLGVDDVQAAERVESFYKTVHNKPVFRTTIKNAEAIKVFYNTAITAKIELANTIMELCHKTGVDCDAVADALALATDRVVSTKYMRGGMGDSGGCFLPDELIYTENGPLEISKIEIGQRVLSPDGKLHTVLETYKRPWKGPVLRIKARGLPVITVTPDHPFLAAKDVSGMFEDVSALSETKAYEVSNRHYFVMPIMKGNEAFPRREGFTFHKIESIDSVQYEGTVWNLNVDETHMYVSVGGSAFNCHPRDLIALSWLSRQVGLKCEWFDKLIEVREKQTEWLADLICEHRSKGPFTLDVMILGEAYKPHVNLVNGSSSILLQNILRERGVDADVYDPWVHEKNRDRPSLLRRTFLSGWSNQMPPMLFFIGINHDEFKSYKFPEGSVVLDPFRYIPDQDKVTVIRIGQAAR